MSSSWRRYNVILMQILHGKGAQFGGHFWLHCTWHHLQVWPRSFRLNKPKNDYITPLNARVLVVMTHCVLLHSGFSGKRSVSVHGKQE